ncbi:MAG: hypothetical protein ACTHLA_12130 [Asticcacaulis sp.]|uniref:hypothetical protein n=1 Tax=Asticcacaulis sp. TaxID=1872648 RepID=UPI003F7C93C0
MAAPGRDIDPHRMALLKGLIQTLPTGVLRSLETARGLSKDAGLASVRSLVAVELDSRQVCETVFLPFVRLFRSREDGLESVQFPRRWLTTIWKQLETREAALYRDAFTACRVHRAEDPTPVVFFRLVKAGAELCRDDPQAVAATDEPEALAQVVELGRYLDLHRIMRQTLSRLPDFLGRMDAEKAAALRVLFKDAAEFEDESGCRFLELVFANLDDGGQIVKLMATVADRPKDRFLAESELACFGERILAQIETRVAKLGRDMGGRAQEGADMALAGQQIAQALAQLQMFEHYIELARNGPWGQRVAAAHKEIAGLVEQVLNGAERRLAQALPTRTERIHGRMKREAPDLSAVTPERLEQTRQILAFIGQARAIAASGGFASLHAKTVEALETQMDAWFGSLLADANSGDLSDVELASEAFERVTGLMQALCGGEKAKTARRRVAASELYRPRANATDAA